MAHVTAPPDPSKMSQIITLADSRLLGFAEYGDPEGVPIVFLHGSPESRVGMQPLHAFGCEHGVRVICPERPGMGLSTPRSKDQPGIDSPVLAHADDIAALAIHLGIQQRWAVVGVSAGGPYALACAHRASNSPSDVPYSDASERSSSSERVKEAWRGLRAVASVAGFGPPPAPLAGMNRLLQLTVLAMRWIPGAAGWLVGSTARLCRNADAQPLRHYVAHTNSSIVPAEDVALLKRPAVREVVVANLREAFSQGADRAALDLEIVLKGFKDGKTGRWGWGFDLEDIDFRGADGQGVRIWCGTKDPNVPTSHGRIYEKLIEGSKYMEYDETHLGLFYNKSGEIMKHVLAAMSSK